MFAGGLGARTPWRAHAYVHGNGVNSLRSACVCMDVGLVVRGRVGHGRHGRNVSSQRPPWRGPHALSSATSPKTAGRGPRAAKSREPAPLLASSRHAPPRPPRNHAIVCHGPLRHDSGWHCWSVLTAGRVRSGSCQFEVAPRVRVPADTATALARSPVAGGARGARPAGHWHPAAAAARGASSCSASPRLRARAAAPVVPFGRGVLCAYWHHSAASAIMQCRCQ